MPSSPVGGQKSTPSKHPTSPGGKQRFLPELPNRPTGGNGGSENQLSYIKGGK